MSVGGAAGNARPGRGRQVNTLASLEESYEAKARRMRAVLADVGFDAAKHANAAAGGPFVSYHLTSNAGPFEKQVYRINVARAQAERLASTVGAIPLRKPVEGEIDTSSSFGVRIDPFLARPILPVGLSGTGEAIRSPPGHRVSAGWAAMAAWSRSITATVCRPATAISRKSTSRWARP
jgi:hypothetical protein